MKKLKTYLKNRLRGAKRVAVLGIGSEERQDDAAGMVAAETLAKKIKNNKRVKIFLGQTAPENLSGEINRFRPSHLIIIDTIEINERPGTVLVLRPEDIGRGVSFSTHKMPAGVLAKYFIDSIGCDIIMIGIQPKSLKFGHPISKTVAGSAGEVAEAIKSSLPK